MEMEERSLNFIEQIVEKDLQEGKNDGRIQTRFPPEPNGYLHIGHVKAICMDFGIAEKYNGVCNLRFDDTNPVKEDVEYVDSIQQDIAWLGFKWGNIYYASDYFQQLYDLAIEFIKQGKAYIDEQTAEQIAEQKRQSKIEYQREGSSHCHVFRHFLFPLKKSFISEAHSSSNIPLTTSVLGWRASGAYLR